MSDYFFSLQLKESELRKMNRGEYYKTASYLRKMRRVVAAQMPPAIKN